MTLREKTTAVQAFAAELCCDMPIEAARLIACIVPMAATDHAAMRCIVTLLVHEAQQTGLPVTAARACEVLAHMYPPAA